MMEPNRLSQTNFVIMEDPDEIIDSFQVPAQDKYNKEIFDRAQNLQVIKQEEDAEELSFVFTNLDTGESNLINLKEVEELDRSNSFKRKQLKISNDGAWYQFWKKVYRNNQQLRAACERGDLNLVKQLVLMKETQYPIDVNSKGFDDWTALHFAAYEDHCLIVQFLLQNGSDINAVTRFYKTALHIASIRGNIETITILVKHQIDINHQDEQGNTALHIATQNGYEAIVDYLIKNNCMILKNKNKQSPLDIPSTPAIKSIFEKNNIKQSQLQSQLDSSELSPNKKPKKLQPNRIIKTPLQNVALTTDSFIYYKLLGKGSFGQVFLVQRKGDDQLYAMKVLSKQKIFGKNLIRYALTQRNVLSAMNHPFIVKLHYSFQNDTKLFLVMEYCPGGDLGKVVAKKKMLTQQQARMYLCELILAFEALHKNMIVFRDLKPDNVVLDVDGHVKLTDFGLSKQGVYNNSTQSFCGSVAYLAPQILTKQGHSRTVDWYLLGLLAYELMVGIPPYYNSKKQVLFDNIKRGPLKIPKSMSEPAKDLIKKLLSRDPSKRLGSQRDAAELREHAFFEGVDWIDVMSKKMPVPKLDLPKVNFNQTIKVSFDEKSEAKGKRIEQWTFINNV